MVRAPTLTRRDAGSIPAGDISFSDLGLSITIDQKAEKTLFNNLYALGQYRKPSGTVHFYEKGKEVIGKTKIFNRLKSCHL
jgi:hypothetical protein